MARKFTAKEYALALQRLPDRTLRDQREAMNAEMSFLAADIKRTFFRGGGRRGPNWVVSRTGRLADSVRPIEARLNRQSQILLAGVQMGGSDAPHAAFIEYGTRGPYVIRPRRASVLRFETEDGEVVFAHEVIHPGIRARAPLGRGVARRQSEIVRRLADKYARTLKEIVA
jgi:hypothetical protein